MLKKTPKSALITIPLRTGTARYTFGQQAILQGKKLLHLLLPMGMTHSPTGLVIHQPASIYVTLTGDDNAIIYETLPSSILYEGVVAGGVRAESMLTLQGKKIAWDKSFLEFVATVANAIPASSAICFLAIYED